MRRYIAEGVGTFGLVLGGCGATVLGTTSSGTTGSGTTGFGFGTTGFQAFGSALGFGLALAVTTAIFAPLSGAHFNPAVTLALASVKRFPWKKTPGYIGAQLAGAGLAASVLFSLVMSRADAGTPATLVNGYGANSPDGYGMVAAIVAELVLTFIFVLAYLSTAEPMQERISLEAARAQRSTYLHVAATLGMTYALVHLVGGPVTKGGANPARSIGPALYGGFDAIAQLGVMVTAPIAGGLLAAQLHRLLWAPRAREEITSAEPTPRRISTPASTPEIASPARRFAMHLPAPAEACENDNGSFDEDTEVESSGPRTLRSPRPPECALHDEDTDVKTTLY